MAPVQTKQPTAVPLNPYIILSIGIMAVSSAAILIRLAQGEGIPSMLIAAGRLTIASIILTPLTLRRYWQHIQELSRSDILLATVSGIFLAIHFATWVTSLEYTTVLISVVLVTTTSLWVALMEVALLGARLGRLILVGLGVAIMGGIVIGIPLDGSAISQQFGGNNTLIGSALSLAGAITVSVYIIIGKRLRKKLPVIPYIWIVYSIAAVILVVVVAGSGLSITGYAPEGYLWLLALGLIPQLIGHSSLNYVLGYLPATFVSMSTQLEPIGSAILAYIIFTEIPAEQQIIGSVIIVIGVMLATWGQRNKSPIPKRRKVTS